MDGIRKAANISIMADRRNQARGLIYDHLRRMTIFRCGAPTFLTACCLEAVMKLTLIPPTVGMLQGVLYIELQRGMA